MANVNSESKATFSRIEHTSINLPKGGGAIRGVGEKFQANPVTGSGSFSLPLPVTPGRGSFQPEMNLSYDSGSGNSVFGLGWNVSVPSIKRKTDKELPQYIDLHESESDTFILAGAEDLVPVMNAAGTERISYTVTETEDGAAITYTVYRYMPRIEGLFAKIEKWVNIGAGVFHWRVTTKDNITSIFGKSENCRISDPANNKKVFEWLIEKSFDAKGNIIAYEYKQENSENVPESINEVLRIKYNSGFANRHIKRVKYSSFDGEADRFHFQLVFDYGEHTADTPEETTNWPCRMDPYSSYKSGFEIRNYRLCRRVLMFHNFPESLAPSGGAGAGVEDSWELVKSMELSYKESRILTYLTSAMIKGYQRTLSGAEGSGYKTKSMPAVEFKYSEPLPGSEIKQMDPESLRNLPAGLDEKTYQWIDLKGEGCPGILSLQGEGVYYKENLGDGKLGDIKSLMTSPPAPLLRGEGGNPSLQVTDIDGDGVNELVIHNDNINGYYRYSDNGWEPFVPFKKNPLLDWSDPNLKMIDLNGDGYADIVISELHAFRIYSSAALEGFDSPVRVPVAHNEFDGPRVVFSDPQQSIYLADMTGDGLTDIVRIRNGEVVYWPNLGYGRFGSIVVMDNAPRFTEDNKKFNQHYIKLGDVDGSGTTDIIYLGNGKPEVYYNCAGNALTPRPPLPSSAGEGEEIPFLPVDSLSSVSMIDLLGKGTMCLVWSTQRPGKQPFQMSYVDLMGTKPHLLTEINDNMGSVVNLGYAPSTKFYLEDKASGRPWITKLNFPVHCLEKVETIDEITGSKLVTTYKYHHGYFDGVEREFRGFGMVETLDTESALTPASPPAPLQDGEGSSTYEHYVAPVLTKTWYHTGAYVEAGKISKQYESEYYKGDAGAYLLPDTVIENLESMNPVEMREAYRALKGSALRQEIYEYGVATPYQVKEASFAVRMLQGCAGRGQACLPPASGKPKNAVFFAHPSEAITFHYEQQERDPRIAHEFFIEVDNYGNVVKKADAVYPRRDLTPPAPLSSEARGEVFAEQMKAYATLTVKEYINEKDDFYRIGLPYSETLYEIGNFTADDQLTLAGMTAICSTALQYVQMPGDLTPQPPLPSSSGEGGNTPYVKLVSKALQHFWNESQDAALTAGETTAKALVHHTETAVLTDALVTAAYGADVTASMLSLAGYIKHDNIWWNPGMTQVYSTGSFNMPVETRDPFGGYVKITYDNYKMIPVHTEDALGNVSTALINYTHMSPKRLTDPNGNVTEAAFDAMGMVIVTCVYGHEENEPMGDTPLYDEEGNDLTPRPPLLEGEGGIIADIITNSANYLQGATTYFYYDLNAWKERKEPPCFIELARETHVSDLAAGETTRIRKTIGYSDGFERELQTKVQVEPGMAWVPDLTPQPPLPNGEGGQPSVIFKEEYTNTRWLVSGRKIYNNKGKPVKQYEPFYSGTYEYEDEEFFNTYGVSSTLHYDPLMRVVRTDMPKGFFSKVEFTPWYVATYDENDTVKDSAYYAKYNELPAEEREALDKAALHYNTPHVVHLDTLGREFAKCEYLIVDATAPAPPEGARLVTYTEYSITGKPLTIRDPRITDLTPRPPLPAGEGGSTPNYAYTYDMHDQVIRTVHIDGGNDRVLHNVMGNAVCTWDAKGTKVTTTYDILQRPVSRYVLNPFGSAQGTALDNIVEYMIYGETVADAAAKNLKGKLYMHYDQAGRVTVPLYSFKGEPRITERQVRTEYKEEVNWPSAESGREALLDTTVYSTDTWYDALGRVDLQTNPDMSITRPQYHLSGNLNRVETKLKGEADFTEQVSGITYNPKGQRERITYGNGTRTDYAYETTIFRLAELKTTRLSDNKVLQNIAYTYDPVGNITLINDKSISTVFSNNQQVEPKQKFTYDALYRLIEAEGREHTALNNPDYYKDTNAFKQSAFISITDANDANRLANYTRRYTYDKAGNMLTIQHIAANSARSFTRTIRVDENSNRWLPANMGNNLTIADYYDPNGNILELETVQEITWNYRDNISRAVLLKRESGTNDAEYYVYDASGQRVRKVRETVTNTSNGTYEVEDKIYLGGVEVKKIRTVQNNQSTTILNRTTLHIMDDKRRIAVVHNWSTDSNNREVNSSADLNTNKIRYQYGNHLDSASLELDSTGQIISYEEYFPYGDTSLIAGTNQKEVKLKEYRYTGKEKDDATGLYYYGARYYASWLGRWLSADPLFRENPSVYERPKPRDKEEAQKAETEYMQKLYSEGLNLYGYVKGNPVIFTDPEGKWLQSNTTISCDNQGVVYTWQQTGGYVGDNDTLWSIAKEELNSEIGANNVTDILILEKVNLIKKLNNLKSDKIIAGQYLATNEVVYSITEPGLEQPLIDPIDAIFIGKGLFTLSKGLLSLSKTGLKGAATKEGLKVAEEAVEEVAIHGNSLKSPMINYGYKIINKETGEILKFGETINPKYRYTKEFYKVNNAYMKIVKEGTKIDIHKWQHEQIVKFIKKHGRLPRLNKSEW